MQEELSHRRIPLHTLAVAIVILISIFFWTRKDVWSPKLSCHALQSPDKIRLDVVSSCLAIDWSHPRFCTLSGNNMLMYGSTFNVSSKLLRDIGVPLNDFEMLKRRNLDNFVFVTAADTQYMHVAMDAIANVQRFFPNHSIYFYDLNINDSVQNFSTKVKALCNVTYRRFNFSHYPPHFRILKTYAFKPVIVHEMLTEFPRVFWMDSSVRFKTGNLSLTLDEVYASGGILTFERTIHSNFEVTHSSTYRYLPILPSDASSTAQYSANAIYIHRNEFLYNRVIAWWVLCALEKECIAPILQLSCNFSGSAVWAGCHRFDQAALNILMAHHFAYDVARYTSRHSQLKIRRYEGHKENLTLCPDRSLVKSSVHFA